MKGNQNQMVLDLLMTGAKVSNVEGCNRLGIGCFQRIVSKLRNNWNIPVQDEEFKSHFGGTYKKYFMPADIIYACKKRDARLLGEVEVMCKRMSMA